MNKSDIASRYQQIALDIAQRIVNGQYKEGEKLHGRSTLSSMYNVSSETVRKAVALLQDMDVVIVYQGSGIVVNSIKQARIFVERFASLQSISSLKKDMENLLKEKQKIDDILFEKIEQIVSYSDELKNSSPYNPIEVIVPENSHAIGCTIAELRFWQNTGGTVVALRRNKKVIISPGPYAIIEEGDSIVVVGENGILSEAKNYIEKKQCPKRKIQDIEIEFVE